MAIVIADFPSKFFEPIPWKKRSLKYQKTAFFSALISTIQPMIKHLEFIQKRLKQKIKISCDRLHKTTVKSPIEMENNQGTLLF